MMASSLEDCQDILMNAPIGIFTSTPEGRFLSVNHAFARMYGFSDPEDLIQSYTDIAGQFYLRPEDRQEFQRRLEQEGEIVNFEYQVRRRDGSIIWVSTNARPVRDNAGNIIQYQGYSTDITERKQSEKNLLQKLDEIEQTKSSLTIAEHRRNILMNSTRDGIAIIDQTHKVIEANQSFADMLGYSIAEVLELHTWDWEAAMNKEEITTLFNDLAGLNQIFETQHVRKDGKIIDVEVSATGARISGQNLVITISRDITERKRIEADLHKRSQAMESSMDGIALLDQNERYVYLNDAHVRIYGYSSAAEILGRPWKMLYDDEELLRFEKDIMPAFFRKGRWKGETRGLRKDGRTFSQEISLTSLDQGGLICVVRDITERKQSVMALQESEERYRKLINTSPDAIALVDEYGRFLTVNPAMARRFGLTQEELAGKTYHDVMPKDLADKRIRDAERSINDEEFIYFEDERQGRYLQNYYVPIATSGQQRTFQIISRDITDRIRDDKAKAEQKALLEAIFLNVPLVLMLVDCERRIQQINGFATQFAGRPAEEMLGLRGGEALRCLHALEHPEGCGFGEHCRHCVIRNIVLTTLEQGTFHFQVEAPYTFYFGGESRNLTLLVSSTPVTFQDARMALVTIQDISERKQFEEQLKYLSLHDQLTGLYNRSYLENELQRLSKSREYPISIISMDMDGLKLVNDTLGHDHGDNLLRVCAHILQGLFRDSDIVARTGGDEFVVLLPRTEFQVGEWIIQRIQTKIDGYNQEQKGQIPLSLSIGLACAEDSDQDLFQVAKQADDFMYRDKLHRDTTSRSQIMKALMAALEERDFITSGHAQRLEDLCLKLGREIGLSASQLSNLNLLAQVHDLGKVGIPDYILFKPGPLTDEEWQIMRQHPEKGHRIAHSSKDLAGISELILKHHERWDGLGYPLGIAGEDIPAECRILAIVDAFDAMTNDRPYRKAISVTQTLEELKKCAGSQFDPYLVEVFLGIMSEE